MGINENFPPCTHSIILHIYELAQNIIPKFDLAYSVNQSPTNRNKFEERKYEYEQHEPTFRELPNPLQFNACWLHKGTADARRHEHEQQ